MALKQKSFSLADFHAFISVDTPQKGRVIIDGNGRILLANVANVIISLEAGQNLFETFADLTLEFSSRTLAKIIQYNTTFSQDLMISKQGTDFWYQLLISPLSADEQGFFLAEFSDITHHKTLEKRNRRYRTQIENEILLRTKEIVQTELFSKDHGGFATNFMRGLRHDLMSPVVQLKDIIAYYKKAKDPRKKERSAQYIDQCLEKLTIITQGFSSFVDLHILPQDNDEMMLVSTVFEETKELLNEKISQAKAVVTGDFTGAKNLRYNKKFFNSLFYNLLSNAIKFRKKEIAPVIEVETFWEDKNFVLSIKDNGIGIDLEKYGHLLFVPFQRLTDRPGNGIGLSMIKHGLLSHHRADIKIDSVVGEWTRVRVLIPQVSYQNETSKLADDRSGTDVQNKL